MKNIEIGENKIYKELPDKMIILSNLVGDRDMFPYIEAYYHVEERRSNGKILKRIETRPFDDVLEYFELLKEFEGFKEYDVVNMERRSLFKRNRGSNYEY